MYYHYTTQPANYLAGLFFRLRNRHFMMLDALLFMSVPALALALRTDQFVPLERYRASLLLVTLLFALVKLLLFYLAGLYSRYWRYASIDELAQIAVAGLAALAVQTFLFFVVLRPLGWISLEFPRSIPLLDGLLTILLVGGLRYSVRLVERIRQRVSGQPQARRLLIVGAGDASVMILKEMQRHPQLGLLPVALIDDDPDKHGTRILGVPVAGDRQQLIEVARRMRAQEVVIAMPTASGKIIREITFACEQAGIKARIMPGIYELLDGHVSVSQLRNVNIEDLLRREPVRTDVTAVAQFIHGRRVLVTGAGGSIGSELCRQIIRYQPAELVVLGHGENSIFAIQNELQRVCREESRAVNGHDAPALLVPAIQAIIADTRFPDRIRQIFEAFAPQIVFHAAAHKHVPLMEKNPAEAITNNVMGTRNLLDASLAAGVAHFIMVSTDKAVNPTSIMGASKRAAELLVHRAARQSGRPYVAVRFGNVLGSRGSVVLTFKQQIAAGGPVTVTDPAMTRFFMTIPEAVQLLLQAAVVGQGGEVFVLDMGEPVKIIDLAQDMIELSGLQVGHDIDIAFTGMRPGEKLFEELFVEGEQYKRTRHEKIFIAANASSFVPDCLPELINALEAAARHNDKEAIRRGLQKLVPEFKPLTFPAEKSQPVVVAKSLETVANDLEQKESRTVSLVSTD